MTGSPAVSRLERFAVALVLAAVTAFAFRGYGDPALWKALGFAGLGLC